MIKVIAERSGCSNTSNNVHLLPLYFKTVWSKDRQIKVELEGKILKFGSDITDQNILKIESPCISVGRKWTTSVASQEPSHCWGRDNITGGVLFGLSRQRTEPPLKGSSFQMKVATAFHFRNQGPESDDSGEAQNPICLKSRTFVHSVRTRASVFSATVALLHFIMCGVNTASMGVEGGDF